ncbi:MAG: peptidase [Cyanobacteria bacterium QH_6_48_35]|nr:MAG: peptidase [Cyanobacteria bacterium QH_1_48_107]PSO66026.1 MAG: peptidase [Cyanobacteria bacterium QH_6_48_35]
MLERFSSFSQRSRRHLLYGLLSATTALSVWAGTPQPSYAISWVELLLQGARVYQLSNMSDEQEVKLGKQINQQISDQVQLYRGQEVNQYVSRIGQQLVRYSDRTDIPYKFQVVEDSSVNAFATMGGYVYVTTGLIKAADNQAQLASVIAHEIGHISSRHSVEQMRQSAIAQGVLSAAGVNQSAAVQIGVDLALQRPNSREDEYEADVRGLRMMRKAGYAPSAMVNFFDELKQQGGSPPTFLSDHPAVSDRVEALKQRIDSPSGGGGLNAQAYKQQIRPLL